MDIFLSRVTSQAMNYAIRSGIAITASYALRQSGRLLKNVEGRDREELMTLQNLLQSKIRILAPAIDMIDLISARGNTSLESAVSLTKSLRCDIQQLGQRLERAAAAEEKARTDTKSKIRIDIEINAVIREIRDLLARIEDAVPMINLAITTSGARLSTRLPSTVSPSRLLQASTFLTAGDTQYSMLPDRAVQIGPTFVLSLYMLFAGYARPQSHEDIRETAWKEVMHKARVKLRRVPMQGVSGSPEDDSVEGHIAAEVRSDEFAYQLLIVEDLDDDRVHTFEDSQIQPGPYEDVELAGMREILPIHQISKIFYADTGKVLNIGAEGETNNPVLLLKRDPDAVPPRRMVEHDPSQLDITTDPSWQDVESPQESSKRTKLETTSSGPWSLPSGLDPEWFAFEVFTDAPDTEDEEDETESPKPSPRPRQPSRQASLDPQIIQDMSALRFDSESPRNPREIAQQTQADPMTMSSPPWTNNIRTSLSLMEMLIRLTSLQQFQQQSHLSITDELLNFFLEESSHTGAGGNEEQRQRLRADARRRVGWDPYDESPMKRHGEDYQYRVPHNSQSPAWDGPYYGGDETEPYFLRSMSQSPGSPSPSLRPARPPIVQTKSMTNPPSSPLPTPELQQKSRASYLRRQKEEKKSSPLRPQTGMTDEGLGTSPGIETQRGT